MWNSYFTQMKVGFLFLFLSIQPNYCSTSVGNALASVNVPVSERVPSVRKGAQNFPGTFIAGSSLAGLVLYLRTGSKINISYYLPDLSSHFQTVTCQNALAFQH